MGVTLTSPGSGGFSSAGDPLLFTDTLLPPDQPFMFGTDWLVQQDPNDIQTMTNGTQWAQAFNRVGAGMNIVNPTGGGTPPRAFCMPRPLSYSRINGRAQFSEYKLESDNSTGGTVTRQGPSVLTDPNVGSCYFLNCTTEIGPRTIEVCRWIAAVATILVSLANAYQIGDTIAFTGNPIVGQVDLTVRINGVVVPALTISDNGGSQIRVGMPGIHCAGYSAGRTVVISNYRGGALSRI